MTSQPNSPTAPPVRILIVDDQPANLQVLGTLLDQRGYDVVPAPDGAAALRRLAIRPPDLVLLDVMMPGMNGFEVCRQIREQRALDDLPVIFLSAADDKEVIVRALESGGVDYVTKPFNPAELLGRVKTHLALKAARDRLRQLAQDKDELLGLLAHDLKNALGSVQMSSQLLAERTVSDTRLHRLSVNIQEAADRTLAFVNQFLANTATERGLTLHPVAMDLAQTAAGVVQEYASRAQRKGIRLHMDPPPAPAPVHADPGALRQVLDNLVSNAVKFSPPDRTVQVSVTAEPG
ncbi:MAG: hybrid sensor histidine kinase/response regulator, partial [Verrucomicrobia bacterium]|nr:hybrid sensor histidine kinase/response regulator [Verrucomicrobiota bacterium]